MFDLQFKLDVEGLEKFTRNIKEKCGKQVVCGIPDNEQYDDGTKIAEVALVQEYGLVDGTKEIHPRPFMSETLKSNKKKYLRMMNGGISSILTGGNTDKNLREVGREMVQDMKLEIDRWSPTDPQSNKEETIERKDKKMGNGQVVLVDSRKMKDAITWWIEPIKKGN